MAKFLSLFGKKGVAKDEAPNVLRRKRPPPDSEKKATDTEKSEPSGAHELSVSQCKDDDDHAHHLQRELDLAREKEKESLRKQLQAEEMTVMLYAAVAQPSASFHGDTFNVHAQLPREVVEHATSPPQSIERDQKPTDSMSQGESPSDLPHVLDRLLLFLGHTSQLFGSISVEGHKNSLILTIVLFVIIMTTICLIYAIITAKLELVLGVASVLAVLYAATHSHGVHKRTEVEKVNLEIKGKQIELETLRVKTLGELALQGRLPNISSMPARRMILQSEERSVEDVTAVE